MPKLFNAEKCLFKTFAVASMTSNATAAGTFTGVTLNDYVCVMYNNDMILTTQSGIDVSISAADTLMFGPTGSSGDSSSIAMTVGVLAMVNPTSGSKGGSW
jgi:hypothetical protein